MHVLPCLCVEMSIIDMPECPSRDIVTRELQRWRVAVAVESEIRWCWFAIQFVYRPAAAAVPHNNVCCVNITRDNTPPAPPIRNPRETRCNVNDQHRRRPSYRCLSPKPQILLCVSF